VRAARLEGRSLAYADTPGVAMLHNQLVLQKINEHLCLGSTICRLQRQLAVRSLARAMRHEELLQLTEPVDAFLSAAARCMHLGWAANCVIGGGEPAPLPTNPMDMTVALQEGFYTFAHPISQNASYDYSITVTQMPTASCSVRPAA